MKKILSLLTMILMVAGVNAYSITTTDGIATPVLTPASVGTGQSVYLSVDLIDYGNTPNYESRVVFLADEIQTGLTLGDIQAISWQAYALTGYMPHLDIKLDINGDGVYDSSDDGLVIEYAKVASPYDNAPYPTGSNWINTFDDKGTIDSNAEMWLSSGSAGAKASANYVEATLAQWQAGNAGTNQNSDASAGLIAVADSISASTKVYSLEFEIDGWISQSLSYIDDIVITTTTGTKTFTFESNNETTMNAIVIETVDEIGITILSGDVEFGTVLSGFDSDVKSIDLAIHTTDQAGVTLTASTSSAFYQSALYLGGVAISSYSGDETTTSITAQLKDIPKGFEGAQSSPLILWVEKNV